jgi:site-specific DNA recombinase
MTTLSLRPRPRRGRGKPAIDLARPLVIVIYARVSRDESGKKKSVSDQEAAIKAAIADAYPAWTVKLVLTDNDISASDKTDKERQDWNRLRELVRKGQYDIVAVWEVSRLSRKAEEGLAFLRECRENGITGIYVAEGYGQLYALDNPKDRSALRKEFDKAEDESDKIQVRVTRGQDGSRKKGRQHGICPYGYERTYDPQTREPAHAVVGAEAEIIREIITYVADGGSVTAMAVRLNKRDVPPPTRPGNRVNRHGWAASTVLGICCNPVYVSRITREPAWHNTEPGNRRFGATMGRNLADLVDAPAYPRILDDETFFRAARNLQDKPRRAFNPHVEVERGAACHLLTHIAVCGVCGGIITPGNRVYQSAAPAARPGTNTAKGKKGFQPLPEGTIRERKVTRYYRCQRKMDVNVPEAAADEHVGALVIAKLAELAAVSWSDQGSEELCRVCAELEDCEARAAERIEDLRAELKKPGGGSPGLVSMYRGLIAELEAEAARLRLEKERQSVPEVLRPFADCGDDQDLIAKVWDRLPLEGKRSVLRTLAESIRMYPAKHSGRGQGPVSERIEVTWNPVYVVSGDTASAADDGNVAS